MGRYEDYAETSYSGLQFLNITYLGNYIYHKVDTGETSRLDLLSYKYYRNPEYWWVIAYANGIDDPLFEASAGDLIKIPEDLQEFLDSLYVGD